MRFLIEQREIAEIGPDVILSHDAFAKMKGQIVAFIQGSGAATVSDLRKHLNTSRRVMVPLLERLDRDGVTRRKGDQRTLAESR